MKTPETENKTKQNTIYFFNQPLQFFGSALLLLLLLLLRILQLPLRRHILRVVLIVSPPRLQTNKKEKVLPLRPSLVKHSLSLLLTYSLHLCGHLEQPILQLQTDLFTLQR